MEFGDIAQLFTQLESTSKRSEKMFHIAEFLQAHPATDETLLLLQGTVFESVDSMNLGVSTQNVIKALTLATGYSKNELTKLWSELGDLGLVASKVCAEKRQQTLFSSPLTVEKVFANLRKLAAISGKDAVSQKVKLIAELLGDASSEESLYVVRFVLEVMRAGVGESTVRDALLFAYLPKVRFMHACDVNGEYYPLADGFGVTFEAIEDNLDSYQEILQKENIVLVRDAQITQSLFDVDFVWAESESEAREWYAKVQETLQDAIDVTNSLTRIAKLLREKDMDGLLAQKPILHHPIKVMLAKKVTDAVAASESAGLPCMVEYKYDGFRMQIHKSTDSKTGEARIQLFTRRLEDVTLQFPEVVEYVEKHVKSSNSILDCEAVGYDPETKKYRPFQFISQRIRRKYEIDKLREELPVELNVFDIILCEIGGELVNVVKYPLSKRRNMLKGIISEVPYEIRVSQGKECANVEEIQDIYQESLDAGNEGVMVKALDAPYKPGSRVGHMVKLKPVLDTLDLVIVKASWGEGKRATWLTSFTVACITEDGELKELGKVSSGLKETEGSTFEALTEQLRKLIIKQDGKDVIVKPSIIIEIAYEEIQKSTTYSSGYALRFPRIVMVRDARGVESASTLDQVEDYYYAQRQQ